MIQIIMHVISMIHISTIMYHLMMSVALKLLEILYRDINI